MNPTKDGRADSFRDDIGFANLDGIVLRTDPISARRFDRVMPLWPEEHLTTAGVLTSLDLQSKRVLEIGCGSGVFSLLCARRGASVVAVDCSARALASTISNATFNNIPWGVAGRDPVTDGKVSILHQYVQSDESIAALLRHAPEDGFDIVIITPPYNPSFPYISPALHASGGADGQAAFLSMVGPAVQLLSPRGYLVCNQMSTVGPAGDVFADRKIRDTFQRRFGSVKVKCEAHHCLNKTQFSTTNFLNGQYERIRQHLQYSDLGLFLGMLEFQRNVQDSWPFLELATYLAYLPEHAVTPNVDLEYARERIEAAGRTWADRVKLHSQIVETATPEGMIQLPFPSTGSPAFGQGIPEYQGSNNRDDKRHQTPRWKAQARVGIDLAAHELVLGSENVAFDLVVIDAAPLADQVGGQTRLTNQITVWVSERLRDALGDGEHKFAQDVATNWQQNTKFQQMTRTGPFLHPWFTGAFSEGEWALAQHSVRLRCGEEQLVDAALGRVDEYCAWNESLVSHEPDEVGHVRKVEYGEGIAIHESEYGDLDVTDPSTFLISVLGSERLDCLWEGICRELNLSGKDQSLLDDTRARVGSLGKYKFDDLHKRVDPGNTQHLALLTKLLRRDVRNCHHRMHRGLEARISNLLPRGSGIGWSSLTGLPLRIRDRSKRRHSGLPVKYRGGVWVYAATLDTSKDVTSFIRHLEFEELSMSISNAVWLNYLDTYGLRSAAQLAESHLFNFSHQVNDALSLLVDLTNTDSPEKEFLRGQASLVQLLFQMHDTDTSPEPVISYDAFTLEMIVEAAVLAGADRMHRELKRRKSDARGEPLPEALQKYSEVRAVAKADEFLLVSRLTELIEQKIKTNDDVLQRVLREARGPVLIFSALRQAYYHAFYDALSGNKKAFVELTGFLEAGDQILCVVRNSGETDQVGNSKDAEQLDMYAHRFSRTQSVGPVPEPERRVWRVEVRFGI